MVEDERLARLELRRLLTEHSEIEVVGEATNTVEALKIIHQTSPDLLFLDIHIAGGSGFEVLEQLDRVPLVIFTTAHSDYALKAFEVNALDYLLKPIDAGRLNEALNRVYHSLERAEINSKLIDKQENNERKLTQNDQVFVKDGEHCWFVKLAEVRMFESVGNYARVHFSNQKPLILKSLNSLENKLDSSLFFRANRQYIINLQWVTLIENWFSGGLKVTLKSNEIIEISRRQAYKFKEKMSL